jgi:uncharacterized protein
MSEKEDTQPPLVAKNPTTQLLLGLAFGLAFGFLLQKGGVAKYHVLVGVLLLRDFTVIKVMLSAILVGMVGIFALRRAGLVKLHVKPTRYAANVIGGLIFGVGFALAAYCPGTGAAALGQGNLDAIAVMLGMVGGSYLFAEASAWIARKINPIGERGELTWPQLLRLPNLSVIVGFTGVILGVLVILWRSGI